MPKGYMPASKSDTHITPDEVHEIVLKKWGLNSSVMFDPCPANSTVNGLTIPWTGWNYVNPPYGDGKKDENGDTLLARFVKKAISELKLGHKSIMLLPSKTDQDWFHSIKNYEIYWFDHRLKFKNNKWSATQPHFLVRIAP